jgi:hypothetical protein
VQVWEKLGLLEEQRFLAADRCQIVRVSMHRCCSSAQQVLFTVDHPPRVAATGTRAGQGQSQLGSVSGSEATRSREET